MTVDAHIHLWVRADGDDIWLPRKIGAMARDFTYDDWVSHADACGVDSAIVVQAAHETRESLRWLAAAPSRPRIAGVVAWADLRAPDLAADIETFRRFEKFVGIRPLPPSTFGADWLRDPAALAGLATLERLGVVVDLLVTWRNLPAAADVLPRFPALNVVLDHCGRPDTMTGELLPWSKDLRSIGKLPNVSVKCSGLVERAGIEWTPEALRPYVAEVVGAFGPERTMFATNWPVLEIGGTYEGWVGAARRIFADLGLSEADRRRIFDGTARRVYRIA
jgi:L-fuconolactonase